MAYLYGAEPVYPAQAGEVHAILGELARRAGLPPPLLYRLADLSMNAFVMGRRGRSTLIVTDGLMRGMTLPELTAVLAHEIGHIYRNDMGFMGLLETLSRLATVCTLIAWIGSLINGVLLGVTGKTPWPWLPLLILFIAPVLVNLLQLALSRHWEYQADQKALELLGEPDWLIFALIRLEQRQGNAYFGRSRKKNWVEGLTLWRYHPSTHDRIQRLLGLALNNVPGHRPLFLPVEIVPGPWHKTSNG